jgi:tRNA A58 N-methylase Trm61
MFYKNVLIKIVQARDAALFLSKHSYKTWIVRSYLEEWDFDEKILKPKNKQLAHTAFLVFGNKI